MDLNAYFNWFKSKQLHIRLFLLIVLVKPFADIFYDLSIVSGITLLKLVGVVISLICFYVIVFQKRIVRGPVLGLLFTWSTLYIINLILVSVFHFNLPGLSQTLKMGMTVYLLFFYFRTVKSTDDVIGYLFTYFLSLIFLIGGFLYSDIFIQEVEITRGAERIISVFGDIGSIGIQFNLGFITLIFLNSVNHIVGTKSFLPKVLPIYILIGFYILIKIQHSASYIIFFLLLAYYLFTASRENLGRTILIGVLVAVPVSIYFYDEIFANLNMLLNTDIAVVQGEKDATQAFHGRGARWAAHWGYFTEGGIINLLFGIVGIDHPELIGHGSHNDYLRLSYSSGLIGSLSWVLFNISIGLRTAFSKWAPGLKFGVISIILFWMLQAISLTPSSYHAFNFVYGPLIVLAIRWKQ